MEPTIILFYTFIKLNPTRDSLNMQGIHIKYPLKLTIIAN